MAAKARGVKFGKQPPKPDTVQTKVRVDRQQLSEGTTVKAAAEAGGWSRAPLYRYLKEFGPEAVPESAVETRTPRSRSIYAGKTATVRRGADSPKTRKG
jgi:hypothetical protein